MQWIRQSNISGLKNIGPNLSRHHRIPQVSPLWFRTWRRLSSHLCPQGDQRPSCVILYLVLSCHISKVNLLDIDEDTLTDDFHKLNVFLHRTSWVPQLLGVRVWKVFAVWILFIVWCSTRSQFCHSTSLCKKCYCGWKMTTGNLSETRWLQRSVLANCARFKFVCYSYPLHFGKYVIDYF